MPEQCDGNAIAIIGMAGRFPKAPDIEAFWRNLRDGVEGVSSLTDAELVSSGVPPELLHDPNYVKAGAALDHADCFDADFFGYTPREAELMDPQQRVFLECAWTALEHAGYASETYPGLIGIYAGSAVNTYLVFNLTPNPEVSKLLYRMELGDQLQVIIGNAGDYLTTRVSYKLNLRGPSHQIQCACSTSLVAIHLACQSLLYEECDIALAGGVSVNARQRAGYRYVPGSITSPDGRCRTFDAAAQGTIFGNGVGVVALKRLEDAQRDGDAIHAIIRGSAVNSDGSVKAGFTAPSVEGQTAVILAALANAEVAAETISYVEAHGTGTPLGDPIEIQALTKAYRCSTDKKGFCAIGSLKSSIGHLDAAAGIAGVIKTALALRHQELPPSLHFHTPNPHIDFANSPFYVNATRSAWKAGAHPRRAGVSAFGFGGTNAHVILEEAPATTPSGPGRPWQLLTLSAKTGAALEAASANLAAHLRQHPDRNLADVAYTLQVGRHTFVHRRMLVCSDSADAARVLETHDPQRLRTHISERANQPVAFLFPGQGAHYVTMGAELYQSEPVFRTTVERCCELLLPHLALDLRDILYPAEDRLEAATEWLDQTWLTQPALFVIEYALTQLWMSWGVHPQVMIGHSVGEYVAACLAGVLTLEDALALVAIRGQLVQQLSGGAMLAVPLPEADVWQHMGAMLSLAAVNAPDLCVVSGPAEAIDALHEQLAARGIECRRLHTSHAFHSWMLDSVLDTFAAYVRDIVRSPPRIPYLSNVTGTWITEQDTADPRYWARHLRQTVRFADGVRELLQKPDRILLEVGPGHTLSTLVRRQAGKDATATALASLRHPHDQQPDSVRILRTLGRLWLAGVSVNWAGVYHHEQRRRVPLPTYPFARQRHWIEPHLPASAARAPSAASQLQHTNEGAHIQHHPADAAHGWPESHSGSDAPAAQLEHRIAELWRELLGIAQIGIHDHFFEIGGHSLLATQLVSRLRDAFGIELPMRAIFESPTIAELARRIALALPSAEVAGGTSIPRVSRLDPLPLSFAQQRLWTLDWMQPGSPVYTMPLAVHLTGALDVAALAQSLNTIARRHETLHTSFVMMNGQAVQRISPAIDLVTPVIDLHSLPEQRRDQATQQLIAEAARVSFDLSSAPLIRTTLARCDQQAHVLILNLHHIISDFWSVGVLVGELTRLYEAFTTGKIARLSELPIQYADYAVWQRSWMAGELLRTHLAYWKQQLAALPLLRFPTDRPRPPVQTFRGAKQAFELSTAVYQAISALSQREDATLFMIVLAAFLVVLHYESKQNDIVVGTDVANRTRSELEGLIGFFVNQLVLRTDLAGDPSFRALLARVRATTLDAYAHQDVPFDELVKELSPERDASRSMFFQVKIVLQNVPMPALEAAGLTLRPVAIDNQTAKYDLLLNLDQAEQGITGWLEYNTDLFDPTSSIRVLSHFQAVLQTVAAQPELSLHELAERLAEADRERKRNQAKTAERLGLQKLKQIKRQQLRVVLDHEE